MKKVFIAALAVCGFSFANAQNTSNSTTPGGVTTPVTSSASISVTLHNALEITPAAAASPYTATFQTVGDYNGAAKNMGSNNWNVKSTKPGVISIAISNLQDPSSGGQTIPVNKMEYDAGSGFNTASIGAVSVGSFVAGAVNPFSLALRIHPGWSYQGGVYNGSVTVTASQN